MPSTPVVVCDGVFVSDVVSLLDRPVYTYPQVDRLLGLSRGTAQRWLNGYKRNRVSYEPILRVEPVDTRWVNWGEFVETRLFAGYRDVENIPVKRMRRVVEELRRRFNRKYPLAFSAPYLAPEGRTVLLQAQQVAGLTDEFALEIGTGQIALAPWVSRFAESARFDPDSTNVRSLLADPDFPEVSLDPTLRGGEPVVGDRNILVTTIAGLVRGGEDPAEVADWYGLGVGQVEQAVTYDRVHPRIA